MTILVIVQARCGSSRLKNKVLLLLNNKSIIQTISDRVRKSKYINKFVIATSTNIEDKLILCNFTSFGG
jgi:spore coat polysaccharide biosynthesis protein SpsF (cytidylyltransferase family)